MASEVPGFTVQMTDPPQEHTITLKSETWHRRQYEKEQRASYRDRARKVFPMVIFSEHAHVHPTHGGAFIEGNVFLTDDPSQDVDPTSENERLKTRAFNLGLGMMEAMSERDRARIAACSDAHELQVFNKLATDLWAEGIAAKAEVAALKEKLARAEETRDAAQAEATKQTELKRKILDRLRMPVVQGIACEGQCEAVLRHPNWRQNCTKSLRHAGLHSFFEPEAFES